MSVATSKIKNHFIQWEHLFFFLLIVFITLALTGCDIESNFAPVTEIDNIEPILKTKLDHSIDHREPNYQISKWIWPAQGKVIMTFSQNHKGINIASRLGEPIYAAAPGKVVYVGAGLRGYGKLIIIKHNSLYLSAYAHNNIILVKEGAWVKAGQKIAEMGHTGTDKVMLHFEIRRVSKPVDPLILL